MNSDLYFDGKKFISSSRAAKISGYVNDYIGQLCRDGKLECRMVGRSWYVSLESLTQHKNSNGTSTRSKGSKKGIITPIEISEVVFTTSPKIEQGGLLNSADEYVVTVPAEVFAVAPSVSPVSTLVLPEIFSINRSYPLFHTKALDTESVSIPVRVVSTPVVSAPTVLSEVAPEIAEAVTPVEVVSIPEAVVISERTVRSPYQTLRFAAGAIAIFFAILGFRFGLSVSPVSQQEYSGVLSSVSDALPANVFSVLGNSFNNGVLAVYTQLRNWLMDSRQTIFVLSGSSPPARGDTSSDSPVVPTTPSQGMVVVPITAETNQKAVVAEVKNTFSDEVQVKQSDSESGVITPVFKKAKGNDYLYVLVPIQK